jgi:hypothetical protein
MGFKEKKICTTYHARLILLHLLHVSEKLLGFSPYVIFTSILLFPLSFEVAVYASFFLWGIPEVV